MPKPGALTIQGVIVPTAWDAKGRVIAVGISAIDEQEYLLADSPKALELLGLVRREVEVSGVVTEHEGGVRKIHIETYKIIRRSENNEIS